jgi:hypothetical protein
LLKCGAKIGKRYKSPWSKRRKILEKTDVSKCGKRNLEIDYQKTENINPVSPCLVKTGNSGFFLTG